MHYRIYKDTAGQWRWRLLATNSRIIADSAESYWNKADCMAGINLVKSSSQAPIYDA
jgi:uncharacterized protein YegP (UPF0339 family)